MRNLVKALTVAGLAAVGFAVSSSSATANWQYTQWNMTPAEVKAVSQDKAQDNHDRELDAQNRQAKLTAPYQGEAIAFRAVFLFNEEDELKTVTLTPANREDCPLVLNRLVTHYGRAKEDSDMIHADIARWDDYEASNLVVYLKLGKEGCTIQYSKLPPTHPDGNNL